MAHELDADVLLFLSGTERFVIHADTPQEFSSAVSFVAAGENRKAIITSLDKVKEALAGKTGTLITK